MARNICPERFVSRAAIVVMIALLLLVSGGCGREAAPDRPNIVVILIDTLRVGYLEDPDLPTASHPYLAGLLENGSCWDNAISTSSWTAPATASVFTGLYPNQHGVMQGFHAHKTAVKKLRKTGQASFPLNAMPTDIPTLPERLKKLGYRTFGLAANINIGPEIGFSRGFDRFAMLDDAPADSLADRLLTWLPEMTAGPEPYFLYLHLNDPHQPYIGHEQWYVPVANDAVADARARYLSEISFLDHQLARIHKELDLDRQGLLVVLSDHGEEFMDHGRMYHPPSLFGELNDVLLVFSGPALGVRPHRWSQNVSLVDVLPTVLDLLGETMDGPAAGISLAPLLLVGGKDGAALTVSLDERTLFAHRLQDLRLGRQLWSANQGTWKLIENKSGNRNLFDLDGDPREQHPLGLPEGPVTSHLTAELDRFKTLPPVGTWPSTEVELDEKMLKKLKSLGYVR